MRATAAENQEGERGGIDRGLSRPVLTEAEILGRLEEEVERAMRYRRPLALAVVALEEPCTARTAERAASLLRRVDRVGVVGERELCALLPETGPTVVETPLRRLIGMLGGGRAGAACCPEDAASARALLEGARLAARSAPAGGLVVLAAGLAAPDEPGPIAVDGKMVALVDRARRIARGDLPVLVTGETGVGKEVLARAVHGWSPRARAPFVAVSCAAIPDGLLESELFGHVPGAFTGASREKPGLFESAANGTLLLDEIGECSPRAQAELLRVLETRQVRRLGALAERAVDVRVIAATNRELAAEVEAGRFRRDLYYRLAAARLVVPPLRERPLDLPVLARAFLAELGRRRGSPPPQLTAGALRRLQLHTWPGNVRELRNAIELAVELADTGAIDAAHLPEEIGAAAAPWLVRELREPEAGPRPPLYQEIRELEARRIREALAACDGVRVRTAERLGIPLRTLVTKLREHGLQSIPRGRRPR